MPGQNLPDPVDEYVTAEDTQDLDGIVAAFSMDGLIVRVRHQLVTDDLHRSLDMRLHGTSPLTAAEGADIIVLHAAKTEPEPPACPSATAP